MTDTVVQQQVCKNCGKTYTENFCNRCGQKEAHRITIPHVFHDMVHVFLHADKGIFPFITRLVFYPGIMAREYVEGKRKIFNPFQYLIFSVGFVLFLMSLSDFYESMESYNAQNASRLPVYFQKAMADFSYFVKTNSNIITFATLPVYALFSWLYFKKRDQNYAEHFTILVFAMSQLYTLNALVLIALLIYGSTGLGTVAVTLSLIIISLFITYKQFYKLKWYSAAWKGVLVYATSYITQVLLMGIGLLIYILVLKNNG